MPDVLQRDLQAHVRHGGGDYGVRLQLSLRVQVAGGGQQHAIAVHDAAGRVAEEGTVGIAIEGHAQIEFAGRFRDDFPQRLGMQCATAFVDVFSVGRDVDEGRLNSQSAKQFRRFGRGRAVGAIHQHAQFAQVRLHVFR